MKKFMTIGLSAMFGLFAASCSEDAIDNVENSSSETATSYISVNICDVGATTTRATGGDFVYGTAAERAVTNAKFLFYDKSGNLISESSLWSETDPMTGESNSNEKEAVEFFGKASIPVENIMAGNKPTMMVTIVNPSASLTNSATLAGVIESLSGTAKGLYLPSATAANKYFIMSTSSYQNSENNRTYYYATDLEGVTFYDTKDEADKASDRVNIYVERLAAKVTVDIDSSDNTKMVKGNADNVYKIGDFEVNRVGTDGNIVSTTETLYAKLLSWGINSTTQDSYIFKHLSKAANWTTTFGTNFVWNDAANHRSYWGDSYNYGDVDAKFYYPSRYQKVYENTIGKRLNYISGDEINVNFKDADYCNENTNTAGVIEAKNIHAVCTSVLVKADLTNADGTANYFADAVDTAGDIIRYNGKFYTPSAYVKYVYTLTKGLSELAQYTHDGTALQESDLVVGNGDILNGRVALKLSDAAAAYTWASSNDATESSADIVAAINKVYQDFQKDNDANGYHKGSMYYSIPIEHLNNPVATTTTTGDASITTTTQKTSVVEAQYGVVRNHLYSLSINEIKNVGFGIEDPTEPIIPNPIETQDFYIGATINILAWKTVSQSVQLQ
jgi:hypothetical protein